MVADIEELEEMDALEIHARRLNAKEVLTPMKGDSFMFPVADGTVKIFGGDRRLRPSTLIRDCPASETIIILNEERNKKFFEENQTDSLLQLLFMMTQHGTMRKPKIISGPFREIPIIAITWNQSQTVHAERKIIFLFQRSTSTLPERLTHPWMK